MNITSEQYQNAITSRNDQIKRLNAGTKRSMTIIYILIGLSLVFFIIDLISKNIINLIIVLLLWGAAALLFYLMRKNISDYTVKECHTPHSSDIADLEKLMNAESFSNDFVRMANQLLSKETDICARGYIRRLLTGGYFFRGEFDIAFRTNYCDEELFAKDKYYELVYLQNVVFYYFNMPSTTGGTEYGEEAYRHFEDLCAGGKVNMKNISVLNVVVSCELNYAAAHGDWQRVLDYMDIISHSYKNVEQSPSFGAKAEYAELMLKKAEALYNLGQIHEAKVLLFDWSEYLKPFPYQYNKAQRLMQDISQEHTEVQ
ncbi:MAG: hypothetical protein MR038_02715 [Oscillospiraceae bacterium]|nr:hypothetical protein [Oscillospiraceae bacterium]